MITITLQGTNIAHLGKRKIIFHGALIGGNVRSQEGIQVAMSTKGWLQQFFAHKRRGAASKDGCAARMLANQDKFILRWMLDISLCHTMSQFELV